MPVAVLRRPRREDRLLPAKRSRRHFVKHQPFGANEAVLRNMAENFEIAFGELKRSNGIKITGNEETKEYVIRREIATKPGDVFSAD